MTVTSHLYIGITIISSERLVLQTLNSF